MTVWAASIKILGLKINTTKTTVKPPSSKVSSKLFVKYLYICILIPKKPSTKNDQYVILLLISLLIFNGVKS